MEVVGGLGCLVTLPCCYGALCVLGSAAELGIGQGRAF